MSVSKQLLRFIAAGAVGALLYLLLLIVLTDFVGVWYLGSSIIAMIANNCVNFYLHKNWTFKSSDPSVVRLQMIHYAWLALAVFVINTGLLYLLVDWVGMWYLLAQLIATAVVTVISFIVSRWIFVPNGG